MHDEIVQGKDILQSRHALHGAPGCHDGVAVLRELIALQGTMGIFERVTMTAR